MKIASIYDFRAYPPQGGNHLHALQLIRQFQSAGHQVLTWGDASVPGTRSFSRNADGGQQLEDEADVLYVRVDGNMIGTDLPLLELLRRARKPVVWEINSPANETLAFSYLGGGALAPGSTRPVWDGAKRRLHAWRKAPGIRQEDALRRVLAARVFGAVCVSNGVARYASEALGISNVLMIPNGADVDAQQPTGPMAELPTEFGGNLTVLFAGSPIYPWQGLDVLQETMALCDRAGDPVRFVLLLNQEGPQKFESRNALILHQVPHSEIGNYLRAVDIGLYIDPKFFWSRWGNHRSPMKMFEYMAFGRPVVGSDVGQIAEVITDGRNGYLFDNTAEGLRQCLLTAARTRELLPRMGLAARNDVEQTFNWREVARRTLELLKAAIESGAQSRGLLKKVGP